MANDYRDCNFDNVVEVLTQVLDRQARGTRVDVTDLENEVAKEFSPEAKNDVVVFIWIATKQGRDPRFRRDGNDIWLV